eukprot:TRINITY_DN3473_c0_g1_i1.p1 TRINITY_DN3473_c0_g1~~TRINITY_DN3473_c0_g1_i1.p1  ORF type:complete len:458 (+),score=74.22 TRINITY_DN3473_c0_g1_i1:290-1663(+)
MAFILSPLYPSFRPGIANIQIPFFNRSWCSHLFFHHSPKEGSISLRPVRLNRVFCIQDTPLTRESSDYGCTQVTPEKWDVLGLGQAMVDFSGMVDDCFLEKLGLQKGTRKIVNHEERGTVLQAMDGCSFKAAAGGSLSNTLVALARLGGGFNCEPPLRVAMAGTVGSDPLGHFYRAKLKRAGVTFLSKPVKDGTTGTVIVLTTPDAQRTMLSYQGMSSVVSFDESFSNLIARSKILVIEGYLCEFPQTIEAIAEACKVAHRNRVLVAVTTSDVSCIVRHHKKFWDIIADHADIIFANSDEARALCCFSSSTDPLLAAKYLSHYSPLVSVTDGESGSYIAVKGKAIHIPPAPSVPIDSCGAGDAYAAGILYGILKGSSCLGSIGNLASRVAAVVVGQKGTRLSEDDAAELTKALPFSENQNTVFSWMLNQIRSADPEKDTCKLFTDDVLSLPELYGVI